MIFERLTQRDVGQYACVAENDVGKTTRVVHVALKGMIDVRLFMFVWGVEYLTHLQSCALKSNIRGCRLHVQKPQNVLSENK